MQRLIYSSLINWKKSANPLPLIIRGARQIGKSYIIEKFGHDAFENVVTANFEFQPELKACFRDLDPESIINQLELVLKCKIQKGQTLLFIDEIQECPQAIIALRYFKEKMPGQHVISAGSLLEFVLDDASFRMPVGRIQFLYMYPLTFKEYLKALGYQQLASFIESVQLNESIPEAIHHKLLKLLREYLVVGGMPAVIQKYKETKRLHASQIIQTNLLTTYENDFSKYAKTTQIKYLKLIFKKSPELITQQFRYVNVARDLLSRDIKTALELLTKANIIHQVMSTSAHGLPLHAFTNPKKFKILFLDVGLANRTTMLDMDILIKEEKIINDRGTLAEQFVGQEILANSDPHQPGELLYWKREKKSSTAEVDFVVNIGSQILPIEVKSGRIGKLRSLKLMLDELNLPLGLRISQNTFQKDTNIQSIPLYLVSEISRLLK